jgi:YD repeat-containing protein
MSDATGANYDYDAEGRMTSFSNSSATATYTYDGIGKRVHRVVNGTRYDYVAAELCVQKVDHREGQDRETPQNEGSRHCRERNRESHRADLVRRNDAAASWCSGCGGCSREGDRENAGAR